MTTIVVILACLLAPSALGAEQCQDSAADATYEGQASLLQSKTKLESEVAVKMREMEEAATNKGTSVQKKSLRLLIQSVYKIKGVGIVPVGKVESGCIKPGMNVTFGPMGYAANVKSVEMNQKSVKEACEGDDVGFNVELKDPKNIIERGYVASDSNNDPAKDTAYFVAEVTVMNHPGKLMNGYTPIIKIGTTHTACKFALIKSKKIGEKGKVIKDPEFIQSGDIAMVEMIPQIPVVVERFKDYPSLGNFTIRDGRHTVGVGWVTEVVNKDYTGK